MTPEQRNFFRNLVHMVLQAAITRAIWGLPLPLLLIIIAACIGAVIYFQLY